MCLIFSLATQLLLTLVALLVPPSVFAQVPDVGILTYNSRDAKELESGCPACWSKARRLWLCCSKLADQADSRFAVTLASGQSTTVTNALFLSTSTLQCSCDTELASKTGPICNQNGRWVARLWVINVQAGSAKLGHSYTQGDETVVCSIE